MTNATFNPTAAGLALTQSVKADKLTKHAEEFTALNDLANAKELPTPEGGAYAVTPYVATLHALARMSKKLLTPAQYAEYLTIRANNGAGVTAESERAAKLFALQSLQDAFKAHFIPGL
mgnify:CR=1 FL=1